MRVLVLVLVIVFMICGTPLMAMNVPSQGPPSEDIPVQAGGYMTTNDLILVTLLVLLVIVVVF
jgi:hypothetical protein